MALPLVFQVKKSFSDQLLPEQKSVFGRYSSDTTSSLSLDNSNVPIRVDSQGFLVHGTNFSSNPSYLTQLLPTSSLTGPILNMQEARSYCVIFNVNGGTFSGAIAVQGSNDGVNFVDINAVPITSSGASGSLQGSFYGADIQVQVRYTSGSGAALTASVVTKA